MSYTQLLPCGTENMAHIHFQYPRKQGWVVNDIYILYICGWCFFGPQGIRHMFKWPVRSRKDMSEYSVKYFIWSFAGNYCFPGSLTPWKYKLMELLTAEPTTWLAANSYSFIVSVVESTVLELISKCPKK